jgi:hypothetical protein
MSTQSALDKLLFPPILAYAVALWSSKCDSHYLEHQVIHNKPLGETGNYRRGILIGQLHGTLNFEPIRDFINRLTAKRFAHCPSHPKSWFNKSEIAP